MPARDALKAAEQMEGLVRLMKATPNIRMEPWHVNYLLWCVCASVRVCVCACV